MEHVNLLICTPGHSLMASYVKSLLATANVLGQEGITWAWSCEYSSHVGDAREYTLSGTNLNDLSNSKPLAGNLTYDKILWIDSDILFTPEQVLKLYHSDKEIISGAYLLASGQVVAYPEMTKPPYTVDQFKEMSGVVSVDAVGFGFVCVSQGIFEKMSRPWFQAMVYETKDESTGEVLRIPLLGEDLSWCERAKRLGYKIWLDTDVKLIHHKMMKLTWEGPRP